MTDAGARTSGQGRIDMAGLDYSLGLLLRLSQLKVFQHFFDVMGHTGLKPGEFSVLWMIRSNPGIRQGHLAQTLAIKNAHMTKLIRSFEADGLLTRTIPDEDRRAVELALTDRGIDFVNRHEPDFYRHMETIDSPLSETETRELLRLLAKFAGVPQGETA
ncbi:MarR family winged helix-turn-helix transcriptional regulator [Roseibium sp.]|uniref:MarR family winged helix-turn-helix transcriptional regulator n=1 Tax=Roseibium sp. TaxID=1936156 RepID=UPI003A976382